MRIGREIGLCVALAAALGLRAALADAPTAGNASAPAGMEARAQYWFGVAVENIPPVIAKQLKLKADQGLLVVAVLPDSPAEKAGVKADDLLIELNGVPVTSQEDLARAANTRAAEGGENTSAKMTDVKNGAGQAAGPGGGEVMKTSRITLLREGDRTTLEMTPSRRPENMLVMGPRSQGFSAGMATDASGANGLNGANRADVRNIVLPNGRAAQVGPGYRMDLQGDSSAVKVIKQVLGKGETVVISQETDSAGATRCSITVGEKKYAVERGRVDQLPADVQPLARQLLDSMPKDAGVGGGAGGAGLTAAEQELLRRNQELEERVKLLEGLMKKDGSGGEK